MINLLFFSDPIFSRKCPQREDFDAKFSGFFDKLNGVVKTPSVAFRCWQTAVDCPPAVAVWDNGYMEW